MNRFYFFLFLSICPVVSAQDSLKHLTVRSCMLSESLLLQTPVLSDSVNIFGDRYDLSRMLKTKVTPNAFKRNIKLLNADSTTGYFVPNHISKDHASLRFLNFTVTASGFTKTKLKITSPHAVEIYIEGEKVTEKTSVQKSLEKASSVDWSWTLEPRTYEVAVKCLFPANDSIPFGAKIVLEADKSEDLAKLRIAAEQKQRLFTLRDVLEGERPIAAEVSADGKYALLRSTVVLPKGKKYNRTEIFNLTNGKKTVTVDNEKNWKWMPKGSRLYEISEGANGRKLTVKDLLSGEETVSAESLPEGNFEWSPDERFLLFTVTDKAPESKDGGVRQVLTPQDRQSGWRNRSFIYRYDLATGLLQPLVFGYRNVALSAVSPDAQSIVFSTLRDDYTERPFALRTVCLLNLVNMKVDTLWHDIKYGEVACFSPDGKQLLLLGGPESFDGIGKSNAVNGIPNNFDTQAYIYRISDKSVKPLTLHFNPSIQSAQWSKADNNIYFVATDEDYVRCYRYLTKKEKFEKLNLPAEVLQSFNAAIDAPVAVGVGQSASYASTAFKVDLRNDKSAVFADPMKPMMNAIQLGKVQDWTFRSSGKDDIKGRVYYPYDFEDDKRYPLIVYYYGGTTPVSRTFDGRYPFHLYASMGYVVYVIQPSGTIGFGQEFSARHVNAWGKRTADEIIEGVSEFCDVHPFIDRKKIGCIGASYGGFMTMYLLTRTDMFAAAVSHAGISDITSYWGEGYWGYSYNSVAAADSYPWNNTDLFVGHSPLFSADKITTPLLLLHGDADTNVPPGESIQMFTALKILGKPVELITVEGENHHILNYDKRIRWNNSIFAWFAYRLQDDPAWWNELYPKKNY